MNYWAIIPAAGVGKRMGSVIPKQYLPLCEETVINLSLKRFLAVSQITACMVALSEQDKWWNPPDSSKIMTTQGGKDRSESVLNALLALKEQADDKDWVLVHDAVRPCITSKAIEEMISNLQHDTLGGILAVPLNDTLKKVSIESHQSINIRHTVDRTDLWRAQTPQMYPYGLLLHALQDAVEQGIELTDEASAMELQGYVSKIILGSEYNIKITCPEDLLLAELFIHAQNRK